MFHIHTPEMATVVVASELDQSDRVDIDGELVFELNSS